jgi:ubiquinone/menaquinone biosynthesis C-methylase UbiE
MDVTAAKAKEHESWSMVSPAWKRYDAELVAWAAPVSDRMITRLRLEQGERVLDLASGTGEPSLGIAERVGPLGSVLGTDLVADMLAAARDKAERRGLGNVEYRVADAETLEVADGSFDHASMRFGLMFMPQPLVALARLHRALKPGGRLVVATWCAPDKNPWAAIPFAALKRQVEIPAPAPGTPGLFAFADGERLRAIIAEAGFRDVQVEEVANVVGSIRDGKSFCDLIFGLAGSLARLLAPLAMETRKLVTDEVAAELEAKFQRGNRLAVPGAAWVATGTR